MRILLLAVALLICSSASACEGKFVNSITELNWKAMMPIKIGNVPVSDSDIPDTPNQSAPVCVCQISVPPYERIGLTIGYWDPRNIVEVVREPGCFPSMGFSTGSMLGHEIPPGSRQADTDSSKRSFYQAHWIQNPVMSILNIVVNSACVQSESMDVAYMTELDPMWADEELSLILNPEAIVFSNVIAIAACAVDCIAATVGLPIDLLFWCPGCHGSIYPFTGAVAHHVGGVQASLLLAERMTAKLSREFLLNDTSSAMNTSGTCQPGVMPIVKKSQFRYQMIRPIRQTEIPALPFGRSTMIMEAGKEFPVKGEDFVWHTWQKRACCAY